MAKLIALVSYKIFPPQMGGQKHAVFFYRHLQRHFEILLAVSRDNGEATERFVVENFLFPNRQMPLNVLAFFRLKKLAKRFNADCIVAEHSYAGWLAWLLSKFTGKPFVIHSHNIEASRFRQMGRWWWRGYARYEAWIHRQAAHSFFISDEDLQFATGSYLVSPAHCSVAPFGVELFRPVKDAALMLRTRFAIRNRYVFYFNGTLDYKPNEKAIEAMLEEVMPRLYDLDFCVLISGTRLPQGLKKKLNQNKRMIHVGFVPDISLLYQGADAFLNTVQNNSGVKTKVMEALANHCSVVSFDAGASGIPKDLCGKKLYCAANGDWDAFARLVRKTLDGTPAKTPAAFFDYFSWENIAQNAAHHVHAILNNHE